jgi:hypothetical protein
MHVEIGLKTQGQDFSERWAFILQLLRSLDFVEYVKAEENVPVSTNTLSEFLLHGPTMTQQEEVFYEQKKQHFQAWN